MRKYLKDNLLQSVTMLVEATLELDKAKNAGNKAESFEILITSQELVAAMAEMYEKEEGFNKTSAFGEYSLVLLDAASKISDDQEIDTEFINKSAVKLEQFIEKSAIDSFKIVFMPYKLSMWTAMESIWKAAKEDEKCIADVVPIPYFNIADANNITMSYEGDKFPKEVGIKDYRDYKLDVEKADIIVIHNPYDDCNNLTSVHPQFYSSELKKHTECLVYSPYFTFGTYSGEKSKHLYVMPGTINADKIVVQSNKVADIFKSYGFKDEKLMVTGSPKTDEIYNFTREKVELPKEWEEKLKGKKVFLLNTHLSYFPQSYDMAEKTDNNYAVRFHNEILDTFKNRDDVALIWRPHPLLKNMIYERYTQCIEYVEYFEKELLESSNCVIDTYGEYKYSFAYSDAMISTWSSLINEYMVTEKPVLIFQRRLKPEIEAVAPVNRNLNYFRFAGDEPLTFEEFAQMVKEGRDPKKEERIAMLKEAFVNMDGCAGKKAYEEIRKIFL